MYLYCKFRQNYEGVIMETYFKKFLKFLFILFWTVLCVVAFVFTYRHLWTPHIHRWSEWTILREATCTEAGERTRSCECGETRREAIPSEGHTFGEWAVAKAATCTENGESARTCACGERETEVIAATGHDFGEWQVIKEATVTEDGERRASCSVCHELSSDVEVLHATGSPGLSYGFDSKSQTYQVTGIGGCTDSTVYVPAYHQNCPVVGIAQEAFYKCTFLTKIVLSAGLTSIDDYAFYSCTSLTAIDLPDGLTSIGDYAFESCYNLTSIRLPDSLTAVGNAAFNYTGIRGIEYQNGHYFGSERNPYMILLNMVDSDVSSFTCHPDTKVFQSNSLFSSKLTSVKLPAGLLAIDSFAFHNCSLLTAIEIPASVIRMDGSPFVRCEALKTLTVAEGNPVYHSDGNCVIETETKTLVAGCAASVIPTDGSVLKVGDRSFVQHWSLEEIVIPEGITEIGIRAFSDCKKLTRVTVPASVTRINILAFYNCPALKDVYYGGTSADWKKINQSTISGVTIHCTDSNITV